MCGTGAEEWDMASTRILRQQTKKTLRLDWLRGASSVHVTKTNYLGLGSTPQRCSTTREEVVWPQEYYARGAESRGATQWGTDGRETQQMEIPLST